MSSFKKYSRTAIKFLLVADLLITLTVLAFVLAAWLSGLPLPHKLLASLFTAGVLAFALPDAIRELRLLWSPQFDPRERVPADD